MTKTELRALRKFFFLDVADAANHIGHCSIRCWQYWENGGRKIPLDVIHIMNELKKERQKILLSCTKNNDCVDFKSDDLICSKLIQSVKAELFAKNI
jgi:hypothetical protein